MHHVPKMSTVSTLKYQAYGDIPHLGPAMSTTGCREGVNKRSMNGCGADWTCSAVRAESFDWNRFDFPSTPAASVQADQQCLALLDHALSDVGILHQSIKNA